MLPTNCDINKILIDMKLIGKTKKFSKKYSSITNIIYEKIRSVMIDGTINSTYEELSKSIIDCSNGNYEKYIDIQHQYIEIVLIALMYKGVELLLLHNINITLYTSLIFELIVGLSQIYEIVQSDPNLQLILKDVKNHIDLLKSYVNFTKHKLYYDYPNIIISHQYTPIINYISSKLYNFQIQTVRYLENSYDNGGLCLISSPIKSGKTTNCLGVVSFLSTISENVKSKYPQKQCLFCSQNQVDRNQLHYWANCMNILTGNAQILENGSINISKDGKPIKRNLCELIIADFETTLHILIKNSKLILFIDINNFNNYKDDNMINLVKIIKNAPKNTIICSSDIPDIESFNNVITDFREKYNGVLFNQIINMQSNKRSIILDSNNNCIFPHIGVKNKEELQNVINQIYTNEFVRMIYTPASVLTLHKNMMKMIPTEMKKHNINYIDKSHLLTDQSIIINTIISLLKILITTNNYIISKICSTYINISNPNMMYNDISLSMIVTTLPNQIVEYSNEQDIYELLNNGIIIYNTMEYISIKYMKYMYEELCNNNIKQIITNKPSSFQKWTFTDIYILDDFEKNINILSINELPNTIYFHFEEIIKNKLLNEIKYVVAKPSHFVNIYDKVTKEEKTKEKKKGLHRKTRVNIETPIISLQLLNIN